MGNSFIKKVIEAFDRIIGDKDSYGYVYNFEDIDTFLINLIKFYNEYESEVKGHKLKNLLLENFSGALVLAIVDNIDEFNKVSKETINELFKSAYIGYTFYILEDIKECGVDEFLLDNKEWAEVLYCSMIEYLCEYGNIELHSSIYMSMLCEKYKYMSDLKEETKEKLANVLYKLCTNNRKKDKFDFINNTTLSIKMFFKLLPKEIIIMVLNKYPNIWIYNNELDRKQYCHIIDSSNFTVEEREELKRALSEYIFI